MHGWENAYAWQIVNTEKSMDALDVPELKAKTSVAPIDTMVSIANFSSLCINTDLIMP
jgi:hypothetical protein